MGGSDLGGSKFTELILLRYLLCVDLKLTPPTNPPAMV